MYNIDKKEIIRTFKLFYTGGSSMKKIRNILAMLMVFVMLVAVMPMNVFATDSPTEPGAGQPAAGAEENHENEQQDPPAAPVTDLDTAKAEDVKTVDTLSDLSQANKEAAKQAINNASTIEDVKAELGKAQKLNDTKAQAREDLKKLTDLTEDQAKEANKSIDDASDIGAVTDAVTKAKGQDEKAKEAKAEEEKKKAAEELAKAKKDAIEKVKALSDLSEANKTAAEQAINAAKDKDTVAAELGKAQALEDAKKEAKKKINENNSLSDDQKKAAIKKIDEAGTKEAVDAIVKQNTPPAPKTGAFTIDTGYTTYGNIEVNKRTADAEEQVTVTVKPKYGYVVSRVYYRVNGTSVDQTINNYYNSYYYDRYPGYYYGDSYYDYFSYYSEYRNSKYYYNHYSNYHEFLRYEHRSHYLNYKNWDDRYDDDDYYYNWYYYKRNGYRPWYYGRVYDNSLYNTSDKFTMPSGNVTVYVEFTDWSYYGYYYDDYYYYRNKKDNYYERQKKAEEKAKKEEEEAKAKAEAAKQPQIYENKAVISIGSNVLDKVSKNVHTVHQMDTPAYVNNGRVMLPLRFVAEALGLQVSWVPETKTVIIWDLTQRVEIPVKSNRIIVNGITYTSDVKPEIKSSRTMLPIANIARALGLIDGSDIIWDQYNKQVTLTRKVLSK